MVGTVVIVSPCLNDVGAIERTILSVVTQSGDFSIRYHVQDGGSTDGTLEKLALWQARLADVQCPILCRDVWFSYASTPAESRFAAMRQGLEALSGPGKRLTGVLRAGDVFLPGALSHVAAISEQFTPDQVAWLSGAVPLIRDHRLAESLDISMPSAIVAAGLSDGTRWPFLQQSGTFFRRTLWLACQKEEDFAGDGLVLEWQLLQRFALNAKLVQSPHALAACRVLPRQLPLYRQIQARRRMERLTPRPDHKVALEQVLQGGPLLRRVVQGDGTAGPLHIIAEDVTPAARRRFSSLFGQESSAPVVPALPPQVLSEGKLPERGVDRPPLSRLTRETDQNKAMTFVEQHSYRNMLHTASENLSATEALVAASASLCARLKVTTRLGAFWRGGRIWAWDAGWEETLDTEWRAFRQVQSLVNVPPGTGYAAFPWAVLMEAETGAEAKSGPMWQAFRSFCAALPQGGCRITVCQHPALMQHLPLLGQAGVTDVFWPCVTAVAQKQAAAFGLTLHAFPHCPPDMHAAGPPPEERAHLLACLVPKTKELPLPGETQVATPETSLFALCPSGKSDNSPALWQAIGAGAVPVILRDPAAGDGFPDASVPGNPALWQAAVLLCDATPKALAALPDRLRNVMDAPGQMDELHHALRQMRLIYGPQALVHDIQGLMATQAETPGIAAMPAAPARLGRPPRIFGLGPRFARTPLAYAPLRRLIGDRLEFVATPKTADLIVTGWSLDFQDHAADLAQVRRVNPAVRFAVISEEPLWDTVWSGGYSAPNHSFNCGGTAQPYRFLNHANTRIFDFERIPYFLLTADHFCARYVSMLSRYGCMSAHELRRHWLDAAHTAAFVAEFRNDPAFDVWLPDGQRQGLSAYRSAVAQLTPGQTVLRIGKGWTGEEPARQSLPDWHLDKLARLDGQVRVCAACENTYQNNYITEKPFDAFAVGAMPACYAGPGHRLHDLIPPEAMLNSFGLTPEEAAAQISEFSPDLWRAEAWLAAAAALRDRLSDARAVAAERNRVVRETLKEIFAVLQ